MRARTAFAASAALIASGLSFFAAPAAHAASFGTGNIVVLRLGTGGAALSSAATPAFLDEYTPSGTLVQSLAAPTAVNGANRRALMSGTATSEGALALSADGRYLTFAGYDADPGTASISTTTSAVVNRIVARVDGAGTIDTTTALDSYSGTNIRGAVTDDGTQFWLAGPNAATAGVRYATFGATSSTGLNTTVNARVPNIANGQLYFSTSTAVNSLGAGLPTTAGQTFTQIAASPNLYAFALLDLSPTVPGIDTLYAGDELSAGGIRKYSFDGTTWTSQGLTTVPGGARGLTASVDAVGVHLYATSSASLSTVTDTAAFNAPLVGSVTTLASAGANRAFRGVAFAPSGGASVTAPSITTHPASTTINSGESAILNVAATGTQPLHFQWYQGAASDTSTTVGADSDTFTTPALTATTSYWVRVTNAIGAADSQTATVTVAEPACVGPVTTIGAVQGSGDTSPVAGQTVRVRGVVVGDYEGPQPALRGFYLQDAGDGDDSTSDGVFVFDSGANLVSLGQLVEVNGPVSEFQGQTQLTGSASTVSVCGTGTTTASDVTLPTASATELEKHEGMLVRFHQTLTVTEHFQLGRFGQVVVSSGGRLKQPTALYPAGPQASALQAANDLNRLIIDDASQAQNPDPIVFGRDGNPLSAANTLRGGDTVTDPIGVLTYTWAGNAASGNAYRLRPGNALNGAARFDAVNERPAAPPEVGGDVKVASANLLNFFNTFETASTPGNDCTFGVGGAPAECRGPNNATEYSRQLAKEVAALTKIDADVIGIMEMENDGYDSASAIQALVDALNAATAPGRYAFVNPDVALGTLNAAGDDAIKAGQLYRTDRVTPVAGHTFADTTAPDGFWERVPIAQEYEAAHGKRFTVVSNHFKSKGSCPTSGPDADQFDGQGCWNAHRTDEANRLLSFIDTVITPGTGNDKVLLVGDFNSYAKEDPIRALEAGGYTNLVGHFHGDDAYSYVFDGQWAYLDFALASASLLADVTGANDYHINADEPAVLDYNTEFKTAGQISSLYAPDEFRTSDHDSVRVGLHFADTTPPVLTPLVVGTLGDNGWYTSDVNVGWAVEENDSDVTLDGCGPFSVTIDTDGTTFTCTATSEGGTTSSSVTIKRDATDPAVQWNADITDGASYQFGAVPPAPTCTALDVTSGPANCTVSGYATTVGIHTLSATATDNAGNVATESRTYTVGAFTLLGFYAPVDMGGVLNAIKGGSTVPLKFEVFNGDTELTSPSVVESLTSTPITCDTHAAIPEIETPLSGNTQLSYVDGQFHYNWKTPKTSGCFRVTVTTIDGSSLSAMFTLR